MAYTTINKSTDHFNSTIYTGNGTVNTALTTGTFQPDLTWFKNRGTTESHMWMDAVRGATKYIQSNSTAAQGTSADKISAFTSTGVTLGSGAETNENSQPLVCWSWKANGAGSANTDGTITSTVSANTTAGFSIVTGTENASGSWTVGHGLGVAPQVIICKTTGATSDWYMWHESLGPTRLGEKFLKLNSTAVSPANDSVVWNNTVPTSSVFSMGSGVWNDSATFVAYCFAEKTGFSKFGSYTGNGNADGTFIYTGFRPAFFLLKTSSAAGEDWRICDNKRDTENVIDRTLKPNTTAAEADADVMDFCSNGVKLRTTDGGVNYNGRTYIFMAFAEAPLVGSNNVPCTAR